MSRYPAFTNPGSTPIDPTPIYIIDPTSGLPTTINIQTGNIALSNVMLSGNVSVSNFPSTQVITGNINVTTGTTQVSNFPSQQNIIGNVNASVISGNVSVTNFPSTQVITGNTTGVGSRITVTPTVTATAYSAGYVVGGIMTFTNILPAITFNGVLENITLKFKGSIQSSIFYVAIFSGVPSGTFTDNNAPAIATSDSAILLGIYQLSTWLSVLGTHTIYTLDGIAEQIVGTSTSLYAVVISQSTSAALASSSDMSVSIGVIW